MCYVNAAARRAKAGGFVRPHSYSRKQGVVVVDSRSTRSERLLATMVCGTSQSLWLKWPAGVGPEEVNSVSRSRFYLLRNSSVRELRGRAVTT